MNSKSQIKPPSWALSLFRFFCNPEIAEDIEGDLLERFNLSVLTSGHRRARSQFVREVFTLIKPNLFKPLFKKKIISYNHKYSSSTLMLPAMFRNIIKTTFRSLLKQKSYTFINTLGLTVGLASSFLILLWVEDEYRVDGFHEKSANIYQLKRIIYQDDGQNFNTEAIPQPLEIVLEETYPEVDMVTLIGWDIEALFKLEDRSFKETGRYVSPEFLKIFSFPLIIGSKENALNEINSIVISEDLAAKLYGENWQSNILGSTLPLGNNTFTISGVFENPSPHSSLQFQWLIPAQRYISENSWVENWNNGGFQMVVLMKDGADINAFGEKVLNEVNNNIQGGDERIVYQKFSDQYLYSNFENGAAQGGRIDYVRALLIVAICIIIIACINFMNLATARSAIKVKEIGVRKVMGAGRNSLALQFLTEALAIAFTASFFAILIVQLILPGFNQLTGKFIQIDFSAPTYWLMITGIALVTGLLSGMYPAFFLSGINTIHVIRGHIIKVGGGATLRKALVVFQFAISIVLIIGSVSIFRQIMFILDKNLGLDRENIIYVPIEGAILQNFDAYRTELLRIPSISSVASSDQNPLGVGRSTGGANWDGKDPSFQIEISVLSTDHNFLKTMKMELISGSDFSGDFYRDSTSFIINEQLARLMNKDNPVGENFSLWGINGKIIGVVRNFHMESLHEAIEPLIIRSNAIGRLAFIRISGNIQQTVQEIEKVTRRLNPGYPFQYTFLDDQFEQDYKDEMMIADLASYFTVIAIFISCLGLFGLSSFIAQQRVKEIGIRKVLGASITNLFMLLSLNFGKLIIIAFILAAPVGIYFSNNWLEQFTFRISIGPGIIIAAGLGALIIAVATVSFKAIQTALANPVDSLKDE
jgi:ABC-type antimicrobial peptide transport system permease subunit